MIIVGEKINTSRKAVGEAVERRDAGYIVELARAQAQSGADYIDVNAGTFLERETECLCWLVKTIQAELDLPLCLDSPSPEALSEAMKIHRGEPMINSISLERDRYEALLPVITAQPCKVVALCMTQTAMPTTAEARSGAAAEIITNLTSEGIPIENIYVDPLIQPVSVDIQVGKAALIAIRTIMEAHPGVKTICGLSNASFGLPHRHLINRTFLTLCLGYGLSSAILDPTDQQLMAAVLAAEMLLGQDEYCEKYLEAHQQGTLE